METGTGAGAMELYNKDEEDKIIWCHVYVDPENGNPYCGTGTSYEVNDFE